MERIFITHILPTEYVLRYNLSVAGCNFSWNLIRGGLFNQFYSIMPSYVHGKLHDIDMKGLVYSNLRKKCKLLRNMAIILENWIVYKKIPRECNVWLYNISPLNIVLFILLKWFKSGISIYVIILDYTPANDWLSRMFLWAINHCNGTITLARSSLFTVKNTLCLPGVTPSKIDNIPFQNQINHEFLISGVLNERISMLPMLLSIFSKMPDLSLHVAGFGEEKLLIEKYKDFSNIHFHGELNTNDYLELFHMTSFQFSTRNPVYPENLLNFPSKIIEALIHNRIVISTIDYEQLNNNEIKYFKVSSQEEEFAKDLRKIVSMKNIDLLEYANQSNLVISKFNTCIWNNSMSKIEKNK